MLLCACKSLWVKVTYLRFMLFVLFVHIKNIWAKVAYLRFVLFVRVESFCLKNKNYANTSFSLLLARQITLEWRGFLSVPEQKTRKSVYWTIEVSRICWRKWYVWRWLKFLIELVSLLENTSYCWPRNHAKILFRRKGCTMEKFFLLNERKYKIFADKCYCWQVLFSFIFWRW